MISSINTDESVSPSCLPRKPRTKTYLLNGSVKSEDSFIINKTLKNQRDLWSFKCLSTRQKSIYLEENQLQRVHKKVIYSFLCTIKLLYTHESLSLKDNRENEQITQLSNLAMIKKKKKFECLQVERKSTWKKDIIKTSNDDYRVFLKAIKRILGMGYCSAVKSLQPIHGALRFKPQFRKERVI